MKSNVATAHEGGPGFATRMRSVIPGFSCEVNTSGPAANNVAPGPFRSLPAIQDPGRHCSVNVVSRERRVLPGNGLVVDGSSATLSRIAGVQRRGYVPVHTDGGKKRRQGEQLGQTVEGQPLLCP